MLFSGVESIPTIRDWYLQVLKLQLVFIGQPLPFFCVVNQRLIGLVK